MRAVLIVLLRPEGLCRYCDIYKANQHEKLIELIMRDPRIDIITLEAKKNIEGKSFTSDVHPELYEDVYWKWFPSFMLFTRNSWSNPHDKLKGFIYGGKIGVDEKGFPDLIEIPNEYRASAEDIVQWVVNKLDDPMFECIQCKKYSQHVSDNRMAMRRRGSF